MATFLPRASTGVAGLDDVLGGGLARNRLHLLEGSPGAGKTTIALQFLLAGAAANEPGIYVSLAETEHELRDGARSHGWTIGPQIEIFELVPPESVLDPDQHQSLLYSSDLELGETVKRIFDSIDRLKPKRVVIDSLSEIRLLAQSSLRYRRQILALKHYFAQHNSTVIMLDDLTTESTDRAVHSIAHSVIHLDQLAPIYGGERRRLRVVKCRGQSFINGYHDFTIQPGGVVAFPRLVAAEYRKGFAGELVKSGVAATRPAARRRHRRGFEHAGYRPGRDRQIAADPQLRQRRNRARRTRRDVRVRRRARTAAGARQGPRHRPCRHARRPFALHRADGRGRADAGRILAPGPPTASIASGSARW